MTILAQCNIKELLLTQMTLMFLMKYPHVAAIYLTKRLKITIWKVKRQEKKKVPQKQNYNMYQKEKKSHF